MSNSIESYIISKLAERKTANNFRALKPVAHLVDFYSNDYLGFASDGVLKEKIRAEITAYPYYGHGSTGSRLLSGNNEYAEKLETLLAQFHHAEAALLFNSGFDANYGLLSALPYKGDTIIYDELVHASVHDGMRNSKADALPFSHNNITALEEKLAGAKGLKYVVVESVYSMDGDFAPLKEIAALCEKYDAGLIVDEAHANGIFGENGSGLVTALGLESKCLARVYTFGKAIGAHGAAVLGCEPLKDFLINYSRPFIYSTALPFHTLATVKCAYELLPERKADRERLFKNVQTFKTHYHRSSEAKLIESNSPIQSILASGNEKVKAIAGKIQEAGFDVRPILYPTVAKGKERIRICLHSFNTEAEVVKLAAAINAA